MLRQQYRQSFVSHKKKNLTHGFLLSDAHRGEAGHKNAAKRPAAHTNQHQADISSQIAGIYRLGELFRGLDEQIASEAAALAGLTKAQLLEQKLELERSTARKKAKMSGLPEFLASAVTVDALDLRIDKYSGKKRNHANKLMSYPASRVDLLSVPLHLAQHNNTAYDADQSCRLQVVGRAYFVGVDEVSTKETTKVPEVMGLIANPWFYGKPQYTSVLFKRKTDSGLDVYMLGQVRVLFSSEGIKYALVRMYDRVTAAIVPDPTLQQLREHAVSYGISLTTFTPSAEEQAHESGCLQLRLVPEGPTATQVIPLSWLVQSVMILPDHRFPLCAGLRNRFFLNHWFWGAYV